MAFLWPQIIFHKPSFCRQNPYARHLIECLFQAEDWQLFSVMRLKKGRKTHDSALCGPIQFVNHSCRDWNAEYVRDGHDVYVKVVRDIQEGDEVLVHYSGSGRREPRSWDGCQCCLRPSPSPSAANTRSRKVSSIKS